MDSKARILSSITIVFAFYITLYHDTVVGARLYMIGNSLALPYMIRNKCWDVVALLTFLIIMGLPKVIGTH
jgi:presenilin-like A22 family membrane protease